MSTYIPPHRRQEGGATPEGGATHQRGFVHKGAEKDGKGAMLERGGKHEGAAKGASGSNLRADGRDTKASPSIAVKNVKAKKEINFRVTGENLPREDFRVTQATCGEILYRKVEPLKIAMNSLERQCIRYGFAGRDLAVCSRPGHCDVLPLLIPFISSVLRSSTKATLRAEHRLSKRNVTAPAFMVIAPNRARAASLATRVIQLCNGLTVAIEVAHGGIPVSDQLDESPLIDILIATPTRITSLLQLGRLSLKKTRYLVIEGTDMLEELGHRPQISRIIHDEDLPPSAERQSLLIGNNWTKMALLAREILGVDSINLKEVSDAIEIS